MELLIVDRQGTPLERCEEPTAIAHRLAPLGVAVGAIEVDARGPRPQVADVQALAALHRRFAIRYADRVALDGADTHWPLLRAKFRRRHRHADHEVRVFVRGRGLFELPLPDGALARLYCEAGDWIALPPGLDHAFDAGQRPRFDALRLFAQAQGWEAEDGSGADRAPLPDLDHFVAQRQACAV